MGDPGARLRVLVWNVHGFRAGVRSVAGLIASQGPDVVLLNEARFRWRLRSLARRLGMEYASGLSWPSPVTNAVLARRPWRVVSGRRVLLPRLRTRKRRGLMIARLRSAAGSLTAVSLHLGLSDSERVAHARIVTDSLAGEGEPLVLGGDLNETPERPAARWIAQRLNDDIYDIGLKFRHVADRAAE